MWRQGQPPVRGVHGAVIVVLHVQRMEVDLVVVKSRVGARDLKQRGSKVTLI